MIVVVSEERLKKAEIEAKQATLKAVKERHAAVSYTHLTLPTTPYV